MVRVRSGVAHHQRVKKQLARAKGYRGRRSKNLRSVKSALLRSGAYAYRHRRNKKREFRSLWIVRINAAAREAGVSYARFMTGLKVIDARLNRKSLAELALRQPDAFQALVEKVKRAAA